MGDTAGSHSGSPLKPPHEHLPPEIMSLIFAHIMDGQSSRCTWPTRDWRAPKGALKPQGHLLNLKLVCSVWKEIIGSTPELYPIYVMKVTRRKKFEEQFLEIIARASEWSSCEGTLKYELHIHLVSTYKFDGTIMLMRPFFHTIALRLLVFYYRGPSKQLAQLLDAYDPSQSPGLEELHLQAYGTAFNGERDEITYSFVSNKHLTSLTIVAEAARLISPRYKCRLDIPWSQLQRLVIANYNKDADQLRFLFLQCHNLVECSLLDVHGWGFGTPDGQPMRAEFGPDNNPGRAEHDTFVHSRLRHLKINCSQGTISPLFWTLRLPVLQSLTFRSVTCHLDDTHDLPTCLYELYQRAPFPLTHLRLSGCRTPVGPLLELLACLSETLVHLEIKGCSCFDETFITNMTLPADPSQVGSNSMGRSIAPKLERLVLMRENIEFRDQVVVDFVQSRVYDSDSPAAQHFGPAALKFVRFGTDVQQYIEPELVKSWQEKGCDFSSSWIYLITFDPCENSWFYPE